MYRRLLPGEKWTWYWSDTARPILAATLATGVLSVAQPEDIGKLEEFVWLLAAGLIVVGAAISVTPKLRTSAIHIVFGRMSKHV
jgi:formate hydrogenlyase subunit 3/multisubunit Na+/H+ antiporter MnhD subunit